MKNIFITGAYGFLGQSLFRQKIDNLRFFKDLSKREWKKDLRNRIDAESIITPNYDAIIHCAAKVAGLGGHQNKHREFCIDNTLININVLEAARKNNIKTVLAISSIAAFPGSVDKLTEGMMSQGRPHKGELGYSLSKRYLDELIQLYREEDKLDYCSIIPVNLYGPYDNFNLQTAHLIPSLIRKFYEAKIKNTDIEIWGDGNSIRQFCFIDDLSQILIGLLQRIYKLYEVQIFPALPDRLIITKSDTYSVRDVIELLINITGFKGNITYNKNKSNGLRFRECSGNRLKSIYGLEPKTDLESGLQITWEWFYNNYPTVRI